MTVLFSSTDLTDHLRKPVTAEAAASVERVVWGWLKPVLGLATRPAPVPDEVFAWAIELAAIAHENPAGLESYQLGAETSQYSAERRTEILVEAGGGGAGGSLAAAEPSGSFPDAVGWPDPPRIRW